MAKLVHLVILSLALVAAVRACADPQDITVNLNSENGDNAAAGQAGAIGYPYAFLGVPYDSSSGTGGAGSVTPYEMNQGPHEHVDEKPALFASDPTIDAHFGSCVGTDGGYTVVGAADHTGGGAAYFYASLTLSSKVVPATISTNDRYGAACDLASSVAAVGAPGASSSMGEVFIHNRNTPSANAWGALSSPITDGAGSAGDLFGASVALVPSGNAVLVGAPGKDSSNGWAAMYCRDNGGTNAWAECHTFTSGTLVSNSKMGYAVAASSDGIAIGIPGNDEIALFEGTATATTASYTFEQMLSVADLPDGSYHGASVARSELFVLTGAPFADLVGADAGMSYVWMKNGSTWEVVNTPYTQNTVQGDQLGTVVAVDNTTALVTSPGSDDKASNGGAGALFFCIEDPIPIPDPPTPSTNNPSPAVALTSALALLFH